MLKAALLVLGGLTLSALVWHIGIGRMYEAVTQLGPVAMLVILLPSLLMYILEAYGWRVTLGTWANGVPFWRVLAIRTAGEVVNMTTPTAYVGGEPLKAFLLKRQGVPIVEGLASVVTAKTTMTIAQILFILAGIGLGFWLLGSGGSAGQTTEKRLSLGQSSLTADEYEHLADRSVAGKNLTVAMAQYEKALRLDPGRARVREKRGLLFLERGLAEDALVEFRAMADQGPIPAAAFDGEGRALTHLGRWEEAEKAFRRALALNPQDWRGRLRGWALSPMFRNGIPMPWPRFKPPGLSRPEHPGLANNLGQTYVALGRYDDAIASFRLGGAQAPDHPRLTKNLIDALRLAGQYDAAEQVTGLR